ncbi:MAG: hypothetical protein ACW960_00970 [Candidatus Thorarchaeota archaeon]|jgi:ribosomal protein S18 acetylase RimI-like enzyme
MSILEIDVRLATAQDRASLEEFYKREGLDFHGLSSRQPLSSIGAVRETMYIVAATNDIVVAALKLDVVRDPGLGDIGHILHFEIEDALESTDLGNRMLGKTIELAQEKGLRALDAVVREERADVIALYLDSEFNEMRKDIHLRRYFRERIF